EFVAKAEAACKAEIASLEEQMHLAERQLPNDLEELRSIYAMAILQSTPEGFSYIGLSRNNYVPIQRLAQHEDFEKFIGVEQVLVKHAQGPVHSHNLPDIQAN